jgi:hypothetical protein
VLLFITDQTLHTFEQVTFGIYIPVDTFEQVSVDSPRICFSPLLIKDSIEEEDETGHVIHRFRKLLVIHRFRKVLLLFPEITKAIVLIENNRGKMVFSAN